MKFQSRILLLGAGLFFLGAVASTAMAKTAGYCLECHSRKTLDHLTLSGDQSVYQAKLDPCPGIRSVSEEIFFTESRVVKLDQILQSMNGKGRTSDRLSARISAVGEALLDLKDSRKDSIAQFGQQSSLLRASLQKVYDRILKKRDESDRRWLIGLGSLILLGLLLLLRTGMRKLEQMGRVLLLALFIGTTFTWTACSFRSEQPAEKSPAQERLEQSLSVATKSTTKMEETFCQSILLAEIAREWSKIEPGSAEKAFELAWQIALKARGKAGVVQSLWPHQADASKEKVNLDTVLDLRDEIRNAEGRTWALRVVAEEWIEVDERKGLTALDYASREASEIKDGEVRDRELKPIAEAWAGIDENRALKIARSIRDPFLRVMALASVVRSAKDKEKAKNLLQEISMAVESIPLPYHRARAFVQLSASAAKVFPEEKKAWGEKALGRIQSLENPQLQAFALLDLAFHWVPFDKEQSERFATGISSSFPETRAYAFLHLSRNPDLSKAKAETFLKDALAEIPKISDSFEAQKIQSIVAKEFVRLEPEEAFRLLPKVQDPFYRSEILAELAMRFSAIDKRKGLDLAEKIPLETIRIKVIVGIIGLWMERDRDKVFSLYMQALSAASSIQDPYTRALTLIDLGRDYGRFIRVKESPVFDPALESARQISSAWKKAEVLEALSEVWKKHDKAKAQTILDEVDPSLVRVRESLGEIHLWSKTDPIRALQWAETLPSAFPLEKALALKEAASGIKKTQAVQALNILEKALASVLTLLEGPRRRKLLSELAKESALLDREKTLQRLLQIEDQETRDFLLREAGTALIKEDSLWVMKAANEISEGSLRLALYQKIADATLKRRGITRPGQRALSQWGMGREKGKKDESQAVAHYQAALEEIESIKDARERSHLLGGLAAEWALIDEEKALQVAKKISPDFSEPLSDALLQIGAQLRKWNRKEAQAVFQRSFSSATQIQDPSLRVQRLLQLAHQWQTIDPEKAKEVLKKTESEVLKDFSLDDKGEKVLAEIYLSQANLEPSKALTVVQGAKSSLLKTKVLLEIARNLSKVSLEENLKTLEKSLQSAKASNNPRMMSEIAVTWFALEPDKGLEILAQLEVKEIRIKTLRKMAKQSGTWRSRLLEQAAQEALGIDGLDEKIQCLKEIAGDWVRLDKERAKTLYGAANRIAEKAAR